MHPRAAPFLFSPANAPTSNKTTSNRVGAYGPPVSQRPWTSHAPYSTLSPPSSGLSLQSTILRVASMTTHTTSYSICLPHVPPPKLNATWPASGPERVFMFVLLAFYFYSTSRMQEPGEGEKQSFLAIMCPQLHQTRDGFARTHFFPRSPCMSFFR